MAASVDISDLIAKFSRLRAALLREGDKVVGDAADAALARIKGGTYWRNGSAPRVGPSFSVTSSVSGERTLSSQNLVAVYLDQGTRAHFIRPKVAHGFKGPTQEGQGRRKRGTGKARSVLVFSANGGTRFARVVKHPGTKATKFVDQEVAIAERVLPPKAEDAADAAIRKTGLG